MKKVGKWILNLSSIFILTLGACDIQENKDEYQIVSSEVDYTLNYILERGASISNWEGIYSLINTDYVLLENGIIDIYDSYTASETINANKIEGKTYGLDEYRATYQDGVNYIFADFFDGDTWFRNVDGQIYYNEVEKLDLSYFSSAVGEISSIANYFLNLLTIDSVDGLKGIGFTLEGNCALSEDGNTRVYFKGTYSDYIQQGYIELIALYDSEDNLISFDYTYEDDYSFSSLNTETVTKKTLTAYEFDGTVGKPTWLR